MPSNDVIQLTSILKMTTAQVCETSVTANNNSPLQDYVHQDNQTQPTFDILFCYASSITNEVIQTNLVTCHLFPVVMTSSPRHASNNLPQPVEIKILMVWLINATYFLPILKKLNLILLVTCQSTTSKKY